MLFFVWICCVSCCLFLSEFCQKNAMLYTFSSNTEGTFLQLRGLGLLELLCKHSYLSNNRHAMSEITLSAIVFCTDGMKTGMCCHVRLGLALRKECRTIALLLSKHKSPGCDPSAGGRHAVHLCPVKPDEGLVWRQDESRPWAEVEGLPNNPNAIRSASEVLSRETGSSMCSFARQGVCGRTEAQRLSCRQREACQTHFMPHPFTPVFMFPCNFRCHFYCRKWLQFRL